MQKAAFQQRDEVFPISFISNFFQNLENWENSQIMSFFLITTVKVFNHLYTFQNALSLENTV